jgi:hypothetical protein
MHDGIMAFSPKIVLTTLFPCNAPPETAASVFKAIWGRWGSRHFISGLLTAAESIGPGKKLQRR